MVAMKIDEQDWASMSEAIIACEQDHLSFVMMSEGCKDGILALYRLALDFAYETHKAIVDAEHIEIISYEAKIKVLASLCKTINSCIADFINSILPPLANASFDNFDSDVQSEIANKTGIDPKEFSNSTMTFVAPDGKGGYKPISANSVVDLLKAGKIEKITAIAPGEDLPTYNVLGLDSKTSNDLTDIVEGL